MTELHTILRMEREARIRLNCLREERELKDRECADALEKLNSIKREAYQLGFTGNIMRDAEGNRVDRLAVLEDYCQK